MEVRSVLFRSASDSAPLSLAVGHSAMSGARETRAHRAIFLDNADRPGADALADRLIGDHQDGDVVVMAGTRAGERAPDPHCSFGQEDLRFSHEEAKKNGRAACREKGCQ